MSLGFAQTWLHPAVVNGRSVHLRHPHDADDAVARRQPVERAMDGRPVGLPAPDGIMLNRSMRALGFATFVILWPPAR